ncbi:MAG: proprotein convertase P-domain-containing protein [Sedimentisphaerales bacterium]
MLVLAISAIAAVPCRASIVVVSQDFNLPIPSPDDPDSKLGRGRMADAIIDVTGHYIIDDLNIAVSLTHEAFFDLEIILERPAGTAITLNPPLNDAFIILGPGGSHSAGGSNRFLFDDEAAVGVEDATPPFDQTFRPAAGFALSAFDGQDAFGQWRLQIYDAGIAHTGRLEGIELIISTPEPTSMCLFALAAVIARFSSRPKPSK